MAPAVPVEDVAVAPALAVHRPQVRRRSSSGRRSGRCAGARPPRASPCRPARAVRARRAVIRCPLSLGFAGSARRRQDRRRRGGRRGDCSPESTGLTTDDVRARGPAAPPALRPDPRSNGWTWPTRTARCTTIDRSEDDHEHTFTGGPGGPRPVGAAAPTAPRCRAHARHGDDRLRGHVLGVGAAVPARLDPARAARPVRPPAGAAGRGPGAGRLAGPDPRRRAHRPARGAADVPALALADRSCPCSTSGTSPTRSPPTWSAASSSGSAARRSPSASPSSTPGSRPRGAGWRSASSARAWAAPPSPPSRPSSSPRRSGRASPSTSSPSSSWPTPSLAAAAPARPRPTGRSPPGSLLQRLAGDAADCPSTWQLSFLYAVAFGGFVAFSVYLPTYLTAAYHLDKGDAALRTAGLRRARRAMRPVGGWLSDRLNPVPVSSPASPWSRRSPPSSPSSRRCCRWRRSPSSGMAAALGAGTGAVFALVARMVPAERVGSVTGVVGAAGGLGGLLPAAGDGAGLRGAGWVHRRLRPARGHRAAAPHSSRPPSSGTARLRSRRETTTGARSGTRRPSREE